MQDHVLPVAFKNFSPSKRNTPPSLFFQCSDLILPWLTPQELAIASLTCTTLRNLSNSITLRRSSDASRSLEPLPIPFHSSLDQHPYAFFLYQPTSSPSSNLIRQSWGSTHQNPETETRTETSSLCFVDETGNCASSGCGCEETCEDGCPCVVGFGGFDDGVVFECRPSCGCGLSCGNRVTQRGIRVKLKIVRDSRKGWGLFADQFIPKGQFVCEYAGELLTTKESRLRQQMYDELSSGGHFSPALLVVREHLPSKMACLRLNIDATRIGNVSRFINHSCDRGNLSTALVRSSGVLLPRLCFFASDDIKKDEELTFSYGETRLNSEGLRCFCGSSCCVGILPSEQT
ncbi:PREDICTED: histone-lysine N-methyltransferase SUVR3-like isoform X1 [Fragaria vesca subsp. vesca]|uniref:histone-lysine N-methyltransferase SUVR3-like isoform X1 n=2 Tax=Fragaria vesca subsp. vesca TaxID=101020 RepID=UPI0002C3074F|nr:PREDICTED: histone-lysine N-methyltransferase SUVR3-like isoform X1 [Fragaria vesca subsp. vesca]XP_011459308.1 PREDICTED: histone-lysine N-methyltransferase SUVR3-like isoform X1 [Fragaria vesca subsp. vesca]XP_011459309.1 PREDICTED: histone-lysine N-methyltransferase SUVR3-like isoform X1 [Fragaria vesca subsp. vesca]